MAERITIEKKFDIPTSATLEPSGALFTEPHAFLSLNDNKTEFPISNETCLHKPHEEKTGEKMTQYLIIGRQASVSDIRIDHKSVSRTHAILYFLPDSTSSEWKLHILDCGGKKGTFVNQVRLSPGAKNSAVLKDGDEIQFGTYSQFFRVRLRKEINPTTNNTVTQGKKALTPREQREAEIAAMIKSFDKKPSYNPVITDDFNESQSHHAKKKQVNKILCANPNLEDDGHHLPISHSTEFDSISVKPVTSIGLDPSGSRVITGSSDTTISLYDFGGMTAAHKPFQTVTDINDEGSYPVISISYSSTGDKFVVGTTSPQCTVFDRDGKVLIRFAKGDVYVSDMSRTDGHTNAVTCTSWHPLERDIIATSSLDGSVRLWDLFRGKTTFLGLLKCSAVYRLKDKAGKRSKGVTSVCFHPSGRSFATGDCDGSVQIWSMSQIKNSGISTLLKSHPDQMYSAAHGSNKVISLIYTRDGSKIASRGEDDSIILWNSSNLKDGPLRRWSRGLSSWYETSNCVFSPDGKFLCAGTCVRKPKRENNNTDAADRGKIFFFDCSSEKESPTHQIEVAPVGVSVIRVAWHESLNQIFAGLSNGKSIVLYSPERSKKGALLSTSRSAKKKDALEVLLESRHVNGSSLVLNENKIITPNALPMFRDEHTAAKFKRKRGGKYNNDDNDTAKRRPEPPALGIKTGGVSSVQSSFTQVIAKTLIREKNIAGKDPREELFKYNKGKSYVDHAYDTGSKKILSEKTAEEEQEEMKK